MKENFENYIECGFTLVACAPKGKKPIESGWQNSKSTTMEDYYRWIQKNPNINIGMLTGKSSGVIGIDADGEEGRKHLEKISKGDLPDTAKFTTPGGGIRLLYKYPNHIELKTKVDRLEGEHSEVCFMSDGKQTLLPPSIHPNGGRYEWINAPWDIEIAEMPKWMIDYMTVKNKKNSYIESNKAISTSKDTTISDRYILNKLANSCTSFRNLCIHQKKEGLCEETWFKVSSMFCNCGLSSTALRFSAMSSKHNERSIRRIEELKDKSYGNISCIDMGCDASDIMTCFGTLVKDDKDQITNSPAMMINNYKLLSPPTKEIYKDITKKFTKIKDYTPDKNGRIYRYTKDGPRIISNFIINPKSEIIKTDGCDSESKLILEGILEGGVKLPEVEISMEEFIKMDWITQRWGIRPTISPGRNMKDYLKDCVQQISKDIDINTIYSHTGWTVQDNKYIYLHSKGGIGSDNINTDIPLELSGYSFPKEVRDKKEAIDLSLETLNLAKHDITIPLLSMTYLAPLVGLIAEGNRTPNFVLWVYGLTGSRKTSASLAFLNHFGNFSSNIPPASFKDTANAIELKAHTLKDSLLLIDDYHPNIDGSDARKLASTAERILRMYGDRVGRSRMRADTTLNKTYKPRGMAIVTGEDLPKGASSTARYIGVEIKREDINLDILSKLQKEHKKLAEAMAIYIDWISKNVELVQSFIDEKFDELKIKYKEETTHGRINDAVIWLSISFELLLTFLYEYMFICDDEIEELRLSNEQVIKNILKNQEALYRNQEVELMFIDALEEMINLGKLCLLPVKKQKDNNQIISNYAGKFIGYYDKEFLYLYDSTMYAEVETFLKGKGQSISVSVNTLLKMLRDKNYIKTEEGQLKPKKLVYDSITKNKERIRLVHLYKKNLNLVNYKE
ncbi:MAG: bifunctional DNA primase/polymerase [Romboutsia timonensis]|jgi:hypothetical protein|nr:bifunctional DNA primase/polymerase [uncultured Romboutsia sp.]